MTIKLASGKQSSEKVALFAGQATTVHGRLETAPPTTPEEPKVDEPRPKPSEPKFESTKPVEPPPTDTTTASDAPPSDPETRTHRSFLSSLHPVTYIAAGVTVVSAAVSYVIYRQYQTHVDNYYLLKGFVETHPGDPRVPEEAAVGREEVDKANSSLHLSWLFTGVAVVGGVVTIGSLIWMRRTDDRGAHGAATEPTVTLRVAPTFGGGYVSLVGAF